MVLYSGFDNFIDILQKYTDVLVTLFSSHLQTIHKCYWKVQPKYQYSFENID